MLNSILSDTRCTVNRHNTLDAYLSYILHNYGSISEHWKISILHYLAKHLGYKPLPNYAFRRLGVNPGKHGIVNSYLMPVTLAIPKFNAIRPMVILRRNRLISSNRLLTIYTGKRRKIFYGILGYSNDKQELQLLAYSNQHEQIKSTLLGEMNREQVVSIQNSCYKFEFKPIKNYFHCFTLWFRA